MDISVIIPTYKPRDYIWTCLDSMVSQKLSYDHFEVIIVLNGCCDPWKSQIENYISLSMPNMNVTFIHTDIPGVSNARNLGIDAVKGKYVTFIDDDDYVSDNYLLRMYNNIDDDSIILANTIAFNDNDPNDVLPYQLSEVYNTFSKKNKVHLVSKVRKYFSGPCMKLIPRTIIEDRRFNVNFSNGEDSIYMFLISDRIKNIHFAEDDAIYYRRYRSNSAVTRYRSKLERLKCSINTLKEYIRIYIHNPHSYNFIFFVLRIIVCFKNMTRTLISRNNG